MTNSSLLGGFDDHFVITNDEMYELVYKACSQVTEGTLSSDEDVFLFLSSLMLFVHGQTGVCLNMFWLVPPERKEAVFLMLDGDNYAP